MVTFADDATIDEHLAWLIDSGEPGGAMHHLVTVVTAAGPLGLYDGKLESHVTALAPVATEEDPETFLQRSLVGVAARHAQEKQLIVFVAYAKQVFQARAFTAAEAARAQRLQTQGRLWGASGVAEATIVYAACLDGRRWTGLRYVTGPRAGETEGPAVVRGPVTPGESALRREAFILRRMVGIG